MSPADQVTEILTAFERGEHDAPAALRRLLTLGVDEPQAREMIAIASGGSDVPGITVIISD